MAEVFVFGSSPELAAEALACVREAGHRAAVVTTGGQDAQDYRSLGCAEVVHVQGGNPLPEAYAADVAALLEERAACAFVVCGDATGRDLAARVAGIMDAPMVSEASELRIGEEGMSTSRLAYGGAVSVNMASVHLTKPLFIAEKQVQVVALYPEHRAVEHRVYVVRAAFKGAWVKSPFCQSGKHCTGDGGFSAR